MIFPQEKIKPLKLNQLSTNQQPFSPIKLVFRLPKKSLLITNRQKPRQVPGLRTPSPLGDFNTLEAYLELVKRLNKSLLEAIIGASHIHTGGNADTCATFATLLISQDPLILCEP